MLRKRIWSIDQQTPHVGFWESDRFHGLVFVFFLCLNFFNPGFCFATLTCRKTRFENQTQKAAEQKNQTKPKSPW